jgi:hypothetical protein
LEAAEKGGAFRYTCVAIVVAPVVAAHPVIGQQLAGEADVVYRSGFVYTVDGPRSRAQGFAIRR